MIEMHSLQMSLESVLTTIRRHCLVGLSFAVLASACGSPTAPTPSIPAPTLSAPADDAFAGTPAILVVNNVTSATTAPRTYDFTLATTQAEVGVASPPVVASGVAEAPGGQTSYQVPTPLQTGRRYYWRSRAVQNGAPGPWSSVFRFRVDYAPNAAPVIGAFSPSSPRAEVNAEIGFAVAVTDSQPTPGDLVYEWSAPGGTFTGTGPSARWRAPSVGEPTAFTITLTVIERYTVTDPDGRPESRENRTTASTVVRVNDSRAEITALTNTFLDDFIHPERTPEFCVRNFTDGCEGKAWELDDIKNNRLNYVIDPARSSFRILSISFNGSSTRATVLAPCSFGSTFKQTGQFGVASGTCRLIVVYENWRWFLCESWFDPPLNSVFDAFSRKFIF